MLLGTCDRFHRTLMVMVAMPISLAVRAASDLASVSLVHVGRVPPLGRCILTLATHHFLPNFRQSCLKINKLKTLHRVGICHRDLKAPDIVLNGEEPLLIDFELGTVSDPSGPCYDLLGPKASGIALPEVHAVIARLYMPQLINGVWWDSPAGGLWTDLGHLPEVDT